MAWLYRRADSKYWWLGWRKPDGKTCFKSTKCKDKADAQRQLAAADALNSALASGASLDAIYESLSQRSNPRVTVKAALAQWLSVSESSTAKDTVGRYRLIADAFTAHLGASDKGPMLDEVSTEQVREFLAICHAPCPRWLQQPLSPGYPLLKASLAVPSPSRP